MALADNRYKQLPDGRVVSRNDPEKASIAEADAMMQPGATAPFARRVKAPAMVIRGGNDRSFARDNAEALTELLPDVRLVVTVPGAGHSLYAEKPGPFIDATAPYLFFDVIAILDNHFCHCPLLDRLFARDNTDRLIGRVGGRSLALRQPFHN